MKKQLKPNYYFDYASCTPIDEEIYETYIGLLKNYYINSEAVYKDGLEVHKLVETSREKIAKLLHVATSEVLFTSGASEANSFAIKGYALKNKHKGKHIIANKMEHSSVTNSLDQLEKEFGFEISYVPVDENGYVTLENMKKYIRQDTIMICLMALNNEVGTIQEIEKIAEYVKINSRIAIMSDGVQIIGKHPIHLDNIDLFTFSTHKIFGVKGCGVLIKKKNIELLPLIHGGQQEQSLRGGTLNAPACIIAAKTLRHALEGEREHLQYVKGLNERLRKELAKQEEFVMNSDINASPYILNFSCTKISSEVMMNALNARNIYVSSQSTCSSRTKAPSHTLIAMGKNEKLALGAIRVSFSHRNTIDEVIYLVNSLEEILHEYRT